MSRFLPTVNETECYGKKQNDQEENQSIGEACRSHVDEFQQMMRPEQAPMHVRK